MGDIANYYRDDQIVSQARRDSGKVQQRRVSFSQINMYLRCPRQYYYRYIEGKKEKPGVALLEGSAHHKAVEHNNRNKQARGRDLKPKVLTEVFMGDFRRRVLLEGGKRALDWQDENENKLFKRAKVWHEDYIRQVAPGINPVEIEEKFERDFFVGNKAFSISGIIDLVVPKMVIDYKTTSKARTKNEVDGDLQLSLYALIKKVRRVSFIQFLKKATPEVGAVYSTRTSTQLQYALLVVKEVVEAIDKGAFPLCSPVAWNCSSRFCGYWKICRGKFE